MNILIDTIAYSSFVQNVTWAVEAVRRAPRVFVPIVVLGELRAGFVASSRSAENERILARFINSPRVEVVLIDEDTTHVYGQLYQFLRRAGTPIPANDLWIASLAYQHSLLLLTRDRHFQCLPQISVI